MIVEPELRIPDFAKAGADIISVHAEQASTIHLHRTIGQVRQTVPHASTPCLIEAGRRPRRCANARGHGHCEYISACVTDPYPHALLFLPATLQIKDLGCKAGVVLNPATPITSLEYILDSASCAIASTLLMHLWGVSSLRQLHRQPASRTALSIVWRAHGMVGLLRIQFWGEPQSVEQLSLVLPDDPSLSLQSSTSSSSCPSTRASAARSSSRPRRAAPSRLPVVCQTSRYQLGILVRRANGPLRRFRCLTRRPPRPAPPRHATPPTGGQDPRHQEDVPGARREPVDRG